ncbi:hypothetical protein CEXT_581451 [Caerostris extrusa]|uniref:Uncharacterized protein n=1 Tax=Caerostris extrusa TaxID=172846 RepID=A0AAV4P071_CAEEX|nr:hypothetical protein CEXT_581451 [Caerostris extrusa]
MTRYIHNRHRSVRVDKFVDNISKGNNASLSDDINFLQSSAASRACVSTFKRQKAEIKMVCKVIRSHYSLVCHFHNPCQHILLAASI